MDLITNYVNYADIDLCDKLENMLDSEISEEIYKLCQCKDIFIQVEQKVWELMNDSNSKFSKANFYEGLADEYEAIDEHDMWSACLYNCDLLYMTAIAMVLNLEIPQHSGDTSMFGI